MRCIARCAAYTGPWGRHQHHHRGLHRPFHFLSVSPSQPEYTPIEYEKHTEAQNNKVLGVVSAAANSAVSSARCFTSSVSDDLFPEQPTKDVVVGVRSHTGEMLGVYLMEVVEFLARKGD